MNNREIFLAGCLSVTAHARRVYETLQNSDRPFLAVNKTAYDRMLNLAYLNGLELPG